MNKIIRAACGTDCKKCPAYIARETNDNELRAKTAQEWNKIYQANFKAEEINCTGCLEDGVHSGYCSACPIRACTKEKNLPYCLACNEFKTCLKRTEFESQANIKMQDFFTDSK